MTLDEVFRSALGVLRVKTAPDLAVDLSEWLRGLIVRGQSAHSALAITDGAFVKHLADAARRLGPTASMREIDSLAIEDLYLACGCSIGDRAALAVFEGKCGARIRAVVAGTKSKDRAEAEQRARTLLLVGGTDGSPKIAGYGGRGPLERWVAVVVQRLVITTLREEQVERRAKERAGFETIMATVEPELLYLKQRYRVEVENAVRDALAALPARARSLLRLRLVSSIEVKRIATMYGISRATATRWLTDARDAVSTEIHRLLGERLRLSPSEIPSLARLVASDLDINMSRLLRTR